MIILLRRSPRATIMQSVVKIRGKDQKREPKKTPLQKMKRWTARKGLRWAAQRVGRSKDIMMLKMH